MFSGRSDGRYMHKNRTPGYVTSIPGKMKYQNMRKKKTRRDWLSSARACLQRPNKTL